MDQKAFCLEGNTIRDDTLGASAGRLQCGACQTFLCARQNRRIVRNLMPASIVLFHEPTKFGKALHTRGPRDCGPHMLILQDGEAQKQGAKLVSQKGVDVLGRSAAFRVHPHPGDDLADYLEVPIRKGQMIRQPVQADGRQQIGGRLRLRGQEFCPEQDHPSVPTFITAETVYLPGPENEKRSSSAGDWLEVDKLGHVAFGNTDQRMEGIMVEGQDFCAGNPATQVGKQEYLDIKFASPGRYASWSTFALFIVI
jgi:hypothetical protein